MNEDITLAIFGGSYGARIKIYIHVLKAGSTYGAP